MLELFGSMAREVTARLAMRSVSGAQVAPASVVFHTPPATPAAYMVLLTAKLGSITRPRVRPPMLPGPSAVQLPSARAPTSPPALASASGNRNSPRGVAHHRFDDAELIELVSWDLLHDLAPGHPRLRT